MSPAPWTRPAIASLFTGRMPSRHGVEGPVDRLAQRHATLAEELAARGFAQRGQQRLDQFDLRVFQQPGGADVSRLAPLVSAQSDSNLR